MYNSSLRIIKDSMEAEDIMQESFLTAFTKLHTLKDNSMFGSWLKRIVINASIGALKKNNRLDKTNLDIVEFAISETEEKTENDILGLKAAEVLSKLKELKENYRIILSLHYIEGFDYEEIGDIMNLNQGNVRTIMSRAKDSLRKKLQVI